MKILATEKLSPHKFKDNHGYLICTDCIMARTGKQTYTRDDCFGDGDMTEIEVDRPEKEVFDPKTLASFENVPITIEHPENNVDSDNYSSLSVGYMRDIHKGTYNGQPVMLGTAVITDSEGIEKVESGELTNLSCGYDCDIDDDKNPKQTNIRGNHIALCEIPRAGITHIQDSLSKTKNPKKRAFIDSLVENHISYIEKEPNRFTFLTDDIGKAKRLARKIVGNNFLEDRDTLAIDFYKGNEKRTYKRGVLRNTDLEEYRKEREENKMKKDSQTQEIEEIEKEERRKFGRLYDKMVDLEYGEFTKENPIRNTKFAKDHYWNFMYSEEHFNYFLNWLKRKYPRLYAEYMRKLDEDNDFEYGEDEDNALVSKEEWKEIKNKKYSDYPYDWADSKDTFMRDKKRTRDEKSTWCLWTENGHIMATPKSNFGKRVSDERLIHDLTRGGFRSIESAKRYFEKDGNIVEVHNSWTDDIVKQGKGWANRGKEGMHGYFRTKKEARRQQKAMFARGYKARDGVIIPANSMAEAIAKYRKMIRGRKTDSEDEVEKKVVWLDTGTAWLAPVVVENHTGDKMDIDDWIGWASTKAEEVGADYVLDMEIDDRAKEDHKSVGEYIDDLEESGYVYFDRSHFNMPNIYLQIYSAQVKDPKATDDLSKAPVVKADDIVIW